MDPKQFIKHELAGNLEFVKSTLSDFSDADLFVRPCPGANHAAWQLGHLCNAETFMTGMAGAKAVTLPIFVRAFVAVRSVLPPVCPIRGAASRPSSS